MDRIIVKIIDSIKGLFRKPVTPTPETALEQAVIEPKKVRSSKWRKANPEKVKANSLKWNEANPERVKANKTRWNKEHHAEVLAGKAAYRAKNKDKIKVRHDVLYLQNNEHINKIRRERYHRNKGKGE
jgi:hypothetical protein